MTKSGRKKPETTRCRRDHDPPYLITTRVPSHPSREVKPYTGKRRVGGK